MKTLAAAIAAVLLCAAPAFAHGAPRAAIEKAESSSVEVLSTVTVHWNRGGLISGGKDATYHRELTCSGFVVESDGPISKIATARHCTEDEPISFFGVTLGVYHMVIHDTVFYDGDDGIVTGVYVYPDADVAILTVVSNHPHPALRIANGDLYRGEHLFVFGNPDGMPWTYSDAIATRGNDMLTPAQAGFDYHFANTKFIDCGSCYFGDSGGGVYDDAGRIEGMLNSSFGVASWSGIIPSGEVYGALRASERNPRASCEAPAVYDAVTANKLAAAEVASRPNAAYLVLQDSANALNMCAQEASADPFNPSVEGRPGLASVLQAYLAQQLAMVQVNAKRKPGQATDDYQNVLATIDQYNAWADRHDDVVVRHMLKDWEHRAKAFATANQIAPPADSSDTGDWSAIP